MKCEDVDLNTFSNIPAISFLSFQWVFTKILLVTVIIEKCVIADLIHLYLYVLKKYNFLDINECVLFRHLCPYECINLSGSFNCSCPVGTIYNRNTYKCIGEWANISIAKLNVSEYYSLGTWKLPRYKWASWTIGSLVTWRLPVWFVASLVHNRASPKWDDVMWWGGSYSYKIEIARFRLTYLRQFLL